MAEEIKNLTPSGRIQRPAYSTVAEWVELAWKNIDPTLIQRAFKCCGISNARDSSEDDLIFDYDRVTETRPKSSNYIFTNDENINTNSNEKDSSNNVLPGNSLDDELLEDSLDNELLKGSLNNELVNDKNKEEIIDYYEKESLNYVNSWN
jgi:hypothetical protein